MLPVAVASNTNLRFFECAHLAAEKALMPAGLTPDCSMAADQPSTVRVTASLQLLLLLLLLIALLGIRLC
jgi:hypothetical protein